ncbi:hypothetical protein [Dyella sp.]|uniref:hypothetical protein n=1 Tax=Dyella sp. TaxID=1869338 RepID=UPI002ED41506
MTPLDKPLRRAITVAGIEYTLLIDPDGLRLTQKGRRNGVAKSWKELVGDDPSASQEPSAADLPGAG